MGTKGGFGITGDRGVLGSRDLHTRAVAEQLSSNDATVLRILHDLTEENVVDFRMEGKNKVFTLKRTIVSRNANAFARYERLFSLRVCVIFSQVFMFVTSRSLSGR